MMRTVISLCVLLCLGMSSCILAQEEPVTPNVPTAQAEVTTQEAPDVPVEPLLREAPEDEGSLQLDAFKKAFAFLQTASSPQVLSEGVIQLGESVGHAQLYSYFWELSTEVETNPAFQTVKLRYLPTILSRLAYKKDMDTALHILTSMTMRPHEQTIAATQMMAVLLQQKDLASAERLLDTIPLDSFSAQQLVLSLADSYLEQDKAEDALRILSLVPESLPEAMPRYQKISSIMTSTNDDSGEGGDFSLTAEQANEALAYAKTLEPGAERVAALTLIAQFKAKDKGAAAAIRVANMISDKQKRYLAYAEISAELARGGDYAKAVSITRKIKQPSENAYAVVTLAKALAKAEEFKQAIDILNEARDVTLANAQLPQVAALFGKSKRYNSAILALESISPASLQDASISAYLHAFVQHGPVEKAQLLLANISKPSLQKKERRALLKALIAETRYDEAIQLTQDMSPTKNRIPHYTTILVHARSQAQDGIVQYVASLLEPLLDTPLSPVVHARIQLELIKSHDYLDSDQKIEKRIKALSAFLKKAKRQHKQHTQALDQEWLNLSIALLDMSDVQTALKLIAQLPSDVDKGMALSHWPEDASLNKSKIERYKKDLSKL